VKITAITLHRLRLPLDPPFEAAWDPEPRRHFDACWTPVPNSRANLEPKVSPDKAWGSGWPSSTCGAWVAN